MNNNNGNSSATNIPADNILFEKDYRTKIESTLYN